jgi:flagellar biosynthesis anti-sigma factor FlgM
MGRIKLDGPKDAHVTGVKRQSGVNRKDEIATSGPSSSQQSDTVNLSGRATAVGKMIASAMEAPEIRQDKIETLKPLVESGNYNPPAKDIADAMLKDQI